MKKLLILAVVGLAFTSCKKDRTCVCTSSSGNKTNYTIKESSKGDAKSKCNEYDAQFSIGGGSCALE